MIEVIATVLGIVATPIGAGIRGFIKLQNRINNLENQQGSKHEIVLVKLDSIAEKIDLRCDALENRVERIERKVLNGDYHKYQDHR
jgi:hypothetical protein